MYTESNKKKCPPFFVINTNYVKLNANILSILYNVFSSIDSNKKIKINVETIDNIYEITKYLEKGTNILHKQTYK